MARPRKNTVAAIPEPTPEISSKAFAPTAYELSLLDRKNKRIFKIGTMVYLVIILLSVTIGVSLLS